MAGFGPHNPSSAPTTAPSHSIARTANLRPSDPTGSRSRKMEPYASPPPRIPFPTTNRDKSTTHPNCASHRELELTPRRDDGQPTQVLPLDAANGLDHVRGKWDFRGKRRGDTISEF
ncbi:hypothetical protein GRF29_69g1645343 [Pseudopithomyces chartarum]|uniref:Uncharacterized protein n=1 Tax=Pseudopithomyces chartarum TaxID=1892770 RepID=A0AAN6LZ04_9PLEO|nr:hypothetical protein GRF29_69g1645343 [Pseudopithomyces chartarum]